MGANIFLTLFFNRGMKSQIPKRLPGGTKCTYKVLASQIKTKHESHKHQLKAMSTGNFFSLNRRYVSYCSHKCKLLQCTMDNDLLDAFSSQHGLTLTVL